MYDLLLCSAVYASLLCSAVCASLLCCVCCICLTALLCLLCVPHCFAVSAVHASLLCCACCVCLAVLRYCANQWLLLFSCLVVTLVLKLLRYNEQPQKEESPIVSALITTLSKEWLFPLIG